MKEYEYTRALETPENVIFGKQQAVKNYISKEIGVEFMTNPNDSTLLESKPCTVVNSGVFNESSITQENDKISSLQDLHKEVQMNERFGIVDKKLDERYEELCLSVGRDDKLSNELRSSDSKLGDIVDTKVQEGNNQKESTSKNSIELEI